MKVLTVLLVVLAAVPSKAVDSFNFYEILPEFGDSQMTIRVKPQPLFSYKQLKSDQYYLDQAMMEFSLDACFRQTVYLLRTLERNRGTIMGKNGRDIDVLEFPVEVAVRELKGEELYMRDVPVVVGIGKEPDTAYIKSGEHFHALEISKLTSPEGYSNFLSKMAMPQEQVVMPIPNQEFLVDIYFKWPDVKVKKSDFNVFDLFPSFLLWNQGPIRKLKVHLGTTFCQKMDGKWETHASKHHHILKSSIDEFEEILKLKEDGDVESMIDRLEAYIANSPADKKALFTLMNAYIDQELYTEAEELITRFQPFFATIRDGIANLDSLVAYAERKRNRLLRDRRLFAPDSSHKIEILTPADGDLVTGTTYLQFSLEPAEGEKLLVVDCYLDEQLIGQVSGPPYTVPFKTGSLKGFMDVRVEAFFENRTKTEASIRVRSIEVDTEEDVQLISLRAIVTQGRARFLGELSKADVTIKENGKNLKVREFRKNQAPLRVAFVVDSSISMFGEKLYRAMYAIDRFISKMQPDDRVSIYSFDSKILRLSGFTNNYSSVRPALYTLSPQLSTSLYDAMLVGEDALSTQSGIPVMIVLSDGTDTASSTTDIHIAKSLRRSNTLVYSIILPGDNLGVDNTQGHAFLEEMANLTGSISTRIRSLRTIDSEFDAIYEELRSFYYLDYYSPLSRENERNIKVNIKKPNTRVRFRRLN